jgi:hypothetical protein
MGHHKQKLNGETIIPLHACVILSFQSGLKKKNHNVFMAYIPIKAQTTNTDNYSQFTMANRWV